MMTDYDNSDIEHWEPIPQSAFVSSYAHQTYCDSLAGKSEWLIDTRTRTEQQTEKSIHHYDPCNSPETHVPVQNGGQKEKDHNGHCNRGDISRRHWVAANAFRVSGAGAGNGMEPTCTHRTQRAQFVRRFRTCAQWGQRIDTSQTHGLSLNHSTLPTHKNSQRNRTTSPSSEISPNHQDLPAQFEWKFNQIEWQSLN